jgi:hypothetical protein
VKVAGSQRVLRDAIEIVSAAERPLLRHVQLYQWDHGTRYRGWSPRRTLVNRHGVEDPPIEVALSRRLISATPHLASAAICGKKVFDVFEHPNLTAMSISGYRAVRFGVLSRVTALDVAFHSELTGRDTTTPPIAVLGTMFERRSFPVVASLDLSRNGAGATEPFNLGGAVDVIRFLRELTLLPQLRRLRLPPFRSSEDASHLQMLLDRMPDLEALELLRVPPDLARFVSQLHHKNAVISATS